MKIVICEDDVQFRNKLYESLEVICKEIGQDNTVIISFASGEDFLEYYEKTKNIDIILLDILMKDITGIEVARRIRNEDSNMQIFFLTSMKNYVLEGYNLRAANYLLKPVQCGRLKSEILKAVNNINKFSQNYLVEKNDSGIYKIYVEEIIYIETYLRNTQIHTDTDIVLSYKSMKQHMERIETEDFFRIHESYIVQLKYIIKVKGYEVFLLNGRILPLSKSRKKLFMDSLTLFYGKLV